MQSSAPQHQTAHRNVSEHDGSGFPHRLVSELTSQSNAVPTNDRTSATVTAGAAAIGTSPSHGAAAKSDPDNDDDTDTTSSEGEDPEITAMREEMIRYADRAPPGPPCHSNAVPRKPRPAPQPIPGAPKQRRGPPAVTLGPGTTAKPKPKSKSKK